MDPRLTARAGEADPDEAATGLSSDQLLDALRRTRSWIILLAVLGLAGGGFLAIVTPNSYMSIGKVMVRWGSREQTTTDAVEGPVHATASSRSEDIQTEIQMLTAPVVFERTVRALGAGTILAAGDPSAEDDAKTPAPIHWFHVAQDWWFGRGVANIVPGGCCPDHSCPRCIDAAVRTLQSRVAIAQSPGTSVIDVCGVAGSPEDARKLVDALLEQIQERHRDFFATDPIFQMLSTQMEEAKTARDNAAFSLADSRQQCHVYDLPAQRNALLKEKDDINVQERTQRTELNSISAQLALYAKWIGIAKERKPEKIQVPAPNPTYDAIGKHIVELQAKRETLLGTHLPDSGEVKELDRQIDAANASLTTTQPTIMVEGSSNPMLEVTRMQGEVERLLARKSGLEAAQQTVAAHRLALDEDLDKLASCEPDLKGKEKDLETKSAAASRYTDAFDRYAVTKALDAAKMSNLRQIQAATLPFEKSGPNRKLFVAGGVMLGAGIGFVLAFLCAAFDRKVRSARDLERRLGVRVICTMPEVGKLRKVAT